MKSPGEIQRGLKYEHHDIVLEDLTERDLRDIRQLAINSFIQSGKVNDNVTMIISAFLTHLASRGYRVTKKEKK